MILLKKLPDSENYGKFSGPMSEKITPYWVDSHIHSTDARWLEQGPGFEAVLQDASKQGIRFFMQGGVSPTEWVQQKKLKKQFTDQIGLCFGVHPYWVSVHSEDELESALDSLASVLPEALALGETGLDLRPAIVGERSELQYRAFELQLELAQMTKKPMVLHLVRAHHEALRFFDVWGLPTAGAMVHSFNGSAKKAADFLELGFYLSVGGPLCRPDNEKLHQAIREIPLERLLIESDGPDQPSPEFAGQLHRPEGILLVAQKVAEIKKISPEEVLDQSRRNFEKLFKVRLV